MDYLIVCHDHDGKWIEDKTVSDDEELLLFIHEARKGVQLTVFKTEQLFCINKVT